MKHILTFVLASVLCIGFSSCVKDSCKNTHTYTYYQPVYKTTAEVRANIRSSSPQPIQNPGKLFIRGNYIFLNEVDEGIHILDNSNPSTPKNIAFINIPGNIDLAVTGNALYADLYTDLVTLDISNPLQVSVQNYNEGVFPHRNYGYGFQADSGRIITKWERRDTTITQDCARQMIWTDNYMNFAQVSTNTTKSSSPVGKGGSMARFAIAGQHLYTVSYSDLNVFDISSVMNPTFSNTVQLNNNGQIETIFPLEHKLFIGSQSGMFIYNISNASQPQKEGEFGHVRSCDPVIADGDYAYVTLRSGSACQGFTNQLDILQLNDFTNPKLIKSYPLYNPHGLSKDGDLLFICDGKNGLKVFDASDASDLKLIKYIEMSETYDVIASGHIALVVAKDGLYQFDYSNPDDIHLLSKIGIKN